MISKRANCSLLVVFAFCLAQGSPANGRSSVASAVIGAGTKCASLELVAFRPAGASQKHKGKRVIAPGTTSKAGVTIMATPGCSPAEAHADTAVASHLRFRYQWAADAAPPLDMKEVPAEVTDPMWRESSQTYLYELGLPDPPSGGTLLWISVTAAGAQPITIKMKL